MPHQTTKYNYLQSQFDKQTQSQPTGNKNSTPPSLTSSPIPSSPHRSSFRQYTMPISSQFSPYENKNQNIQEKILLQQLTSKNKLLLEQIDQYKHIIDKLQNQIRLRTEDFTSMDILRQKQKQLHQQTINQMKGQIQILLLKNSHLQQKTLVLQSQLRKYETQITKSQARVRSLSAVATNSKQYSKLLSDINNLIQIRFSKIHKKYKNKTQSQSSLTMQLTKCSSPVNSPTPKPITQQTIFEQLSILFHHIQKHQQLLDSIFQMHHKITGKTIRNQPRQLKQIWKWLKELGHRYTITEKWKNVFIDNLGLSNTQNDISINDVLQKIILELHSK